MFSANDRDERNEDSFPGQRKAEKVKIAVYAIALNEQANVARFLSSLDEADGVFVTDTGSTDATVALLRAGGVGVREQRFVPWRFDVARNASLAAVPDDYDVCFCLDLDEVILPGWRTAIDAAWRGDTDRLRYQYVWSFNPDGSPGVSYWADKCHARHGFAWTRPVHEVLQRTDGRPERQAFCAGLRVEHHADAAKSRGSYLPLLELACREDPHDDRSAHYLAREYMYRGMHAQAIAAFERHLALPRAVWAPERAASMRFMARCRTALGDLAGAQAAALRAVAENPGEREPWVDLGRVYYARADWAGAWHAMGQALAITKREASSYICEPEAWGGYPHDVAAIAAWHLGLRKEAREHTRLALGFAPDDARLAGNLKWMEAA